MEKVWRLIIDSAREPVMNMALDEAIMLGMAERPSDPTLRIYRWSYPCISIGRFQRLDVSAPPEGGTPIVRRPTGGGSVSHGERSLTYSMIYREDSGAVAKGTRTSYSQIHNGVAAFLRALGAEAELYAHDSKYGRVFGPCFTSPVASDVVVGNRKVAGAAQRRKAGVVLHQGEVSLDLDVLRKWSYNNVLTAFINSLSKQLDARFLEGQISETESCLAEELVMDHTEEVNR